ncbi:MAG: LysR family transcriptional regulator [Niameybacter sp.]
MTGSITKAAEHLYMGQPNLSKSIKELEAKVEKIAELAVGDACTGSNPRVITPSEMERLFFCH